MGAPDPGSRVYMTLGRAVVVGFGVGVGLLLAWWLVILVIVVLVAAAAGG